MSCELGGLAGQGSGLDPRRLPATALDPASPQAQSWCLQHDLGHTSIFRNSRWNHLAQQFVMGQLKVRVGADGGQQGAERGRGCMGVGVVAWVGVAWPLPLRAPSRAGLLCALVELPALPAPRQAQHLPQGPGCDRGACLPSGGVVRRGAWGDTLRPGLQRKLGGPRAPQPRGGPAPYSV